ncbi:hypothetical protein [Kamptonema sp. UHCC 0994]|uniref:hypothetical protein n=1 Tax=Kamptonema sp. UHCC 0994 TaxID=3031329 RepID=UPI0023B89E54|nr:hypothetical protein [Kamptonema sp. UHCC 0994]MDF0554916.1 hypothetical protein [Kamptonema sp. UHCC 0994]
MRVVRFPFSFFFPDYATLFPLKLDPRKIGLGEIVRVTFSSIISCQLVIANW